DNVPHSCTLKRKHRIRHLEVHDRTPLAAGGTAYTQQQLAWITHMLQHVPATHEIARCVGAGTRKHLGYKFDPLTRCRAAPAVGVGRIEANSRVVAQLAAHRPELASSAANFADP